MRRLRRTVEPHSIVYWKIDRLPSFRFWLAISHQSVIFLVIKASREKWFPEIERDSIAYLTIIVLCDK